MKDEDIKKILDNDPDFINQFERMFAEWWRALDEDAEKRHEQKREFWRKKTEGGDPF